MTCHAAIIISPLFSDMLGDGTEPISRENRPRAYSEN